MKLPQTFVIVWVVLFPKARAEVAIDIEVDGDVRTGIEYEKRKNGAHSYAESTLEFASQRRDGFRAVIEVQGKTETREVRLRDSTVDYKIDDQLRAEIGFSKKRLGIEYNRSSWNRDLINETLLYKKLEELTLV
ncbi:MAG TPA: hypothetical protein VE954_16600, partial [Oligoflexus sp.]|uniref:hypothetical protein n=1 Tax=Oligoflexus sp. TaxID=1971216 RepID=UPI002D32FD4A